MADTSSEADIRGIDIDKLAKGFADEESVFKNFVVNSSTSAREIRWYQKTSGYLDSTDTTGITASQIYNTASKARPVVVEQSWTRQTSYVKKYFVESPWLSDEDIKDSDIDILATNIRDLVRAVAHQVDIRIWDVITDASGIGTGAATGTGWDDLTNGNPIIDILAAKQNMRTNGYNPEGVVLAINPVEHKNLMVYLISTKGSSIPNFSSEKVKTGVVMEILGCKVLVSQNATTDEAALWIPNRAATWKSFIPMTAVTVQDPGIGTKIRVWEEGEAICTDPKAVYVITDTVS
tara:strand:- start:786 stop:1661 length:876 start_codon:yes stop_codon:yes gene_type:complete